MYEAKYVVKNDDAFLTVIANWTNDIKDYFYLGPEKYFNDAQEGLVFFLNRALSLEFSDTKIYNSFDFRRILKTLFNFEANPGTKKRLKIETGFYWSSVVLEFKERILKDKLHKLKNKLTTEGIEKVYTSIMGIKFRMLPEDLKEKIIEIKDLLDAKNEESILSMILFLSTFEALTEAKYKAEKEKEILVMLKSKMQELR